MFDYHLLEWNYSPPDFFEGPFDLEGTSCTIKIAEGRIEAKIEPDDYPPDHSLRDVLQKQLQAVFQPAQVLSHQAFSLSQSNLTSVELDGRKHRRMFAECGSYLIVGQSVGFVLCDGSGNVLRDSKAERRAKRQEVATLAAKLSSSYPFVSAVLNSYTAAVNDPANELIHLYEVRDAVASFFGDKKTACASTGVTVNRWSRLGQLANDEPLSQGRHRGQQLGTMRDATAEELSEARAFASDLISGLLRHLDNLVT